MGAGDAYQKAAVDLLGELLRRCGNDVAEDVLLGCKARDKGDSRGLTVAENEPYAALGFGVGDHFVNSAGEHEPASGRGLGRGEHRGDKALLGDLAVIEDGNVVAHLFDNAHLVGDDDDRYAELPVYVLYQFKDLTCRFRVEGAGGLVAQQNLGVGGERAGNGYALLLAAGELSGIGVCLVGKTDKLKKLSCAFFGLGLFDACKLHREADILQACALHEQIEVLEDHRYVASCRAKLSRAHCVKPLAVYDYLAARGLFEQVYASHERALSCAGHAYYSVYVSVVYGERDVFERVNLAGAGVKGLADVF